MADEIGSDIQIIAIALDDSADVVAEWVEEISFPVLLDREHLMSDLYGVSNVPTVVWIDETSRVVRPNTVAVGTDTFSELTGITAEPGFERIREWVETGEVPDNKNDVAEIEDLSHDEITARLWFRIAAYLRRGGEIDLAAERFERARQLAPLDFTVARAAMPLTGVDPFGAEFFDLYGKWHEAGTPYHGRGPDQ